MEKASIQIGRYNKTNTGNNRFRSEVITKSQENQLAIKLKKYRLKYPEEPIPAFEIVKQKDYEK